MKKLIFSIMLFIAVAAQAVPAFPGLVQFRQPRDGKTVSIYLKGDERVHWAESEDGYSLLHSDDGSLVFAKPDGNGGMTPTTFLAVNKEDRDSETEAFLSTTPKHLHYSQEQVESLTRIWREVENAKSGPKYMSDVIGEKKFLLILFEFSDCHFTHSKNDFAAMMNQVNYTANGYTGSVRDYYYDVSGGLFTLQMDVVGPFTGSHNTAYYGSTDEGSQYFAREAVDSAASYVNFADYDNDGDGYIDGLHIIFAGYGEEAGASSDHIWSHKWNIWNPPTYNNTVVDVYSCSPECSGNYGGFISEIGVICHELGHVFGAPDYYDTDYAGSGGEFPGLGRWDIMSGGSWNCNGRIPAHHNPYTKLYIYNWSTCNVLTNTPGQYVMDPISVNNSSIYRVNTESEGDFFLIENRQQIKWDSYIPGHGMIVYHVHPNADGANVTNHRHPQQIYILAKTSHDQYPNSSPSSYGAINTELATLPGPYPYRDSLTDNSMPWFRPWTRQLNNLPIYNISDDPVTGMLYFSVQNLSPSPLSAHVEGIDNDKLLLSWVRYGTMRTFILRSDNPDQFDEPNDTLNVGDTLPNGNIVVYRGYGNNVVVDGLEQGTRYYFKLFTQHYNGSFSEGIYTDGTTLDCTMENWETEDFQDVAVGSSPNCWLGDWTVEYVGGQHALVSGDSPSSTGREWSRVISRPITDDTVSSRLFHYRMLFYDSCREQTRLKVEYQPSPSGSWTEIDDMAYSPEARTWVDRYMIIDNIGDYSRLRFSLYTDGTDHAAIDDVQLIDGWLIKSKQESGGSIEPLGYNVVNCGDSIEFIVTPNSGYQVHRLVYDNLVINPSRLTPRDDGSFSYKIGEESGIHEITAKFKRSAGIDEIGETTIGVYPNPTSGKLTVECVAGCDIELYDTRGSLVMSQKADDETVVLDMQELPKGIYILRSGRSVTKVVKK